MGEIAPAFRPRLDADAGPCHQSRMPSPVPAFYINLDKRLDRREYFEAQLRRIGMEAERVSAVTPADLDPARIAAVAPYLSPTELACNSSHRKIWQMMLDRGLEGAMIFEDDGVLSTAIPKLLGAPGLAARVDALQFESHPSNALLGPPLPGIDGAVTLNRLMSSSLGTCAYYITARFAAQIIDDPLLEREAIDVMLFGRRGGVIYRARIYQTVPALAVQLESFAASSLSAARSDLESSRTAGRIMRRRMTRNRLGKLALNARHALRVVGSFAPTGELFRARHLKLPVADDIKIQLQSV